MKRCVVVWCPEFDEPGKEGIEAAQTTALDIQRALEGAPAMLAQQGADPDLIKRTVEYLKTFRYAVRKVEL